MATWIAHMRIAQHLMQKHAALNDDRFLVGNIGPDCGVPNEDWSAFTPDTSVSHWRTKDEPYIDAEAFKREHLSHRDERWPFYAGYYAHLLTDIEWAALYARKKSEPLYAEGLNADKNFIWVIKKDWYGQDHVYLQRHPDCVFFTRFAKINAFDNRYFDFYPPDAFTRQIKYITHYYLTAEENPDRPFPFLSADEMDTFVRDAAQTVGSAVEPLLA